MRAAVIEKPSLLVVKDILPPQIGEYDALCKMLFGAICSGTDRHLLDGVFPKQVNYPTVLGHESIGRVIQIGKKVRNLKIGDMITRVGTTPVNGINVNWGGFAELGIAKDYMAMSEDGLPKDEWNRYRVNKVIPRDFDPAASTMIITWRETLSYITRMGVGSGARVLVIGSGGNGLSFVSHAKNLGAERVVIVGSIRRKNVGLEAGATDYFDYKDDNPVDTLRKSGLDEFDFIIDAIGKNGMMNKFLPLVKHSGVIGIYGWDDFYSNSICPNMAKGTFTYYNGGYDEEETHEKVIGYIRKGLLKVDLWVDLKHPIALADINKAMDLVKNGDVVKALIRLSD
jgi:D-arabinose 1-dehydrogenase-like Zn-dependent alcohol dehydrogenase